MQPTFFVMILFLTISSKTFTQHLTDHHYSEHEGSFRIAILIGHTLIPEEHAHENFFIPSWGLDVEYWLNHRLGLGIHSDLELETFAIKQKEGEVEALERMTPLVTTLDILYKPWKNLVFLIGPGIEFEPQENFYLLRAGIEYEYEFNDTWDISPTVFYDARFDGYYTCSVALGIGHRF